MTPALPLRTAIFYAYPTSVNGLHDVSAAVLWWSQYDLVVFGDGLQLAAHEAHEDTKAVMAGLRQDSNTQVYGYVDLGATTQNLSLEEIASRSQAWKEAGAHGIFLDDAGFDYDVSRERFNAAVRSCHELGLPVMANAWRTEDITSSTVVPQWNPQGIQSELKSTDYVLLESLVSQPAPDGNTWVWSTLDVVHQRAHAALTARSHGGPKIVATSVMQWGQNSAADDTALAARQWAALQSAAQFYGLDGYGLDTVEYASEGVSIAQQRFMPYELVPLTTATYSLAEGSQTAVDETHGRHLQWGLAGDVTVTLR